MPDVAASISLRDLTICVLEAQTRESLFAAAHHGYLPREWALVCRADLELARDVRGVLIAHARELASG